MRYPINPNIHNCHDRVQLLITSKYSDVKIHPVTIHNRKATASLQLNFGNIQVFQGQCEKFNPITIHDCLRTASSFLKVNHSGHSSVQLGLLRFGRSGVPVPLPGRVSGRVGVGLVDLGEARAGVVLDEGDVLAHEPRHQLLKQRPHDLARLAHLGARLVVDGAVDEHLSEVVQERLEAVVVVGVAARQFAPDAGEVYGLSDNLVVVGYLATVHWLLEGQG